MVHVLLKRKKVYPLLESKRQLENCKAKKAIVLNDNLPALYDKAFLLAGFRHLLSRLYPLLVSVFRSYIMQKTELEKGNGPVVGDDLKQR